jgi:hypothetical protein
MDLKPQNKKERIALWFIFVLPLIVYWLVLWNNKVTQRYLASLELTEEWKKEIERLNAEYDTKIELDKYSEITNPCFWKNIINDFINSINIDFSDTCSKSILELEKIENDKLWLKETLIGIAQSWVNYSNVEKEIDICLWWEDLNQGDCTEYYNELDKVINETKNYYVQLSDTLWKIENQGIKTDNYFFIPEIMLY